MTEANSTEFLKGAVFNAEGEEEDALPLAVMDASYIASALLCDFCSDESVESRTFMEEIISKNGQIVVPQLFWYEIGNVLLNASKQKKNGSPSRISKVQLDSITLLLGDLPIYTDSQPNGEIRGRIMHMAEEEGLSYYDAAYLELARRQNLPLKTFDEKLKLAAAKI